VAACALKNHLLRQSDALDGEEFLRVYGLVAGDGVGFELRDFAKVLDARHAEAGSAEFVMGDVVGDVWIGDWHGRSAMRAITR
jgi:hypothetical protein